MGSPLQSLNLLEGDINDEGMSTISTYSVSSDSSTSDVKISSMQGSVYTLKLPSSQKASLIKNDDSCIDLNRIK